MIENPTHLHPLTRFFWWRGWTHEKALAWLEENGHLDGQIPEYQEGPILLRQLSMECVEDILLAADAAWAMPENAEGAVWFYGDEYIEQPCNRWRESLEPGDPRRDPESYQVWRRQQNSHYQDYEPEDYHTKPAYQRQRKAQQ